MVSKRRTTHIRVEKDLYKKSKLNFPDFSPNEIFKLGYKTLSGVDKAGKIIYGKKIWRKIK